MNLSHDPIPLKPVILSSPVISVDVDLVPEEQIAELIARCQPVILRYSGKRATHLGVDPTQPVASSIPANIPFDQYWIGELQAEVKALKEKLASKAGGRTILTDSIDSEWLNAIGQQSVRVLGHPWETKDGETREEGLKANVVALFQIIEDERAKNAELRSVLDERVNGVSLPWSEWLKKAEHALSADCGKTWIDMERTS